MIDITHNLSNIELLRTCDGGNMFYTAIFLFYQGDENFILELGDNERYICTLYGKIYNVKFHKYTHEDDGYQRRIEVYANLTLHKIEIRNEKIDKLLE